MLSKIEDYDIAFALRAWQESKYYQPHFLSRNLTNINRDGIQFLADKIYDLFWYDCSKKLRTMIPNTPPYEDLIYELNNYIDLFNHINSISRDDSAKYTMNQIMIKYELSEYRKEFFIKYFKH